MIALFIACVAGGTFIASGIIPLAFDVSSELNRPEARGVMFAVLSIARVVGRGLGGLLVTYSSALWFEGRLSPGLALVSLGLLPAALLFRPVLRTYADERRRLSESLQQYAAAHRSKP